MFRKILLGGLLFCLSSLGADMQSLSQMEEVNLRKALRESKSEGANEIAHLLLANDKIVKLDISCNELGLEGIKPIAVALMYNQKLRILVASYNEFNDESAPHIAAMLLHNDVLETLELFGNVFTVNGVKTILEALKMNHTLKFLSIYCANLNPPECKPFVDEMLLVNKTIETLLIGPLNSVCQKVIDINLSRRGIKCISYF